jgi:uncharacterized membrane protein YfcA
MTAFLILFVSATFGSLVGLGGGIIIVPLLIYLGPHVLGKEIASSVAVGTSLCILIITALASTLTYTKQKKVDFKSGWIFFIASGPGAILGASLTGAMPQKTFQLVFGLFMLLMVGLLLAKSRFRPRGIAWKHNRIYTDAQGLNYNYGTNAAVSLAIGFAVGLISGLFGIGGGALFVPLMVILFAYPPHVAAATSMFVIFLSSIVGSVTHVWLGEIDWLSAAALAPGAWIGGKLGANIATAISGKSLLWLLRTTIFVLAVRMIWEGLS